MFILIDGMAVPAEVVIHPSGSTLTVPAQTLAPGLYIIFVEVTVTGSKFNDTYDEDYVYVRVILPELVASLKGATMRVSNGSETIFFDASASYDLVTGVSVTSDILTTHWSVLSLFGISQIETINCIATFPNCELLESGSVAWFNISDIQASQHLELDTDAFSDNRTVFVIFTISRGPRVSSAIQSVYINSDIRPVTLR